MSTRLSVWQRFQNVVASVFNFENIIGQIPLKLSKASLSSLSGLWIMEAYQMTFIILFITFSGNKFVIYICGLNLNIRPTLHRSLACLKVQFFLASSLISYFQFKQLATMALRAFAGSEGTL